LDILKASFRLSTFAHVGTGTLARPCLAKLDSPSLTTTPSPPTKSTVPSIRTAIARLVLVPPIVTWPRVLSLDAPDCIQTLQL
jgi:hypothetical protein